MVSCSVSLIKRKFKGIKYPPKIILKRVNTVKVKYFARPNVRKIKTKWSLRVLNFAIMIVF